MRANCRHCKFYTSKSDQMELIIAEYLFHVISAHWDILEAAHNDPEGLRLAMAMVRKIGLRNMN